MKQKVNRAIKKRFYKTKGGKGKVMRARAAHGHRLTSKSKEAKNLGTKAQAVSASDAKGMKNQFSLI